MSSSERWTLIFVITFVGVALGCAYWLLVVRGVHVFNRELKLEARANEAVGAKVLPTEPLKLILKENQKTCIKLERVTIDGTTIVGYVRNSCRQTIGFPELAWKVKAPDGTVIEHGSKIGGSLEYGERGEIQWDYFKADPRASTVEVWTKY